MVWYFFSDKKRRRALAAAKRVLRECNEGHYRTDHLHFRFQDASYPEPPPFDKWEAQKESDRLRKEQLERERREEMERREKQRRHAEAVAAVESYLTPKEQEKSIEDARARKSEMGKGWQLTGREREQALIDAMHDKHEREQERERRRRQTRDSISRFFDRA